MYSKDEIIKGMCVTYRHDYGLLPEYEQEAILTQMNQLFEHNFIPFLEDIYDDIRCGCEHCVIAVPNNIKKAMGK